MEATAARSKRALKALRSSQPFNAVATSIMRAAMRVTGRPMEPVVKHLPRVGITSATLPNGQVARFWSRGDDWVPNQVYWRGWDGYEPEMTPLFYAAAQTARVTIDVGAHIGFYAILAALANPAGQVHAFEPTPGAHARLVRNLALNHVANVEAVCAAAGATPGQAELFHGKTDIPCSAGLSRDFVGMLNPNARAMRVDVVRLDDYVAELNVSTVDLVKLDTETTEPEVLEGLAETLARDRPTIFCEVLPQADGARLTALLEPLGYRFSLLTDDGPLERDRVVPDEHHWNQLFEVPQ